MTKTTFESATIIRTIQTLALALAPKGVTLNVSPSSVYIDCQGTAQKQDLIAIRDQVLATVSAQFPGRTMGKASHNGKTCWYWNRDQGLRVGIALVLNETEQFEVLAGNGQDMI